MEPPLPTPLLPTCHSRANWLVCLIVPIKNDTLFTKQRLLQGIRIRYILNTYSIRWLIPRVCF